MDSPRANGRQEIAKDIGDNARSGQELPTSSLPSLVGASQKQSRSPNSQVREPREDLGAQEALS